MKFKILMIMIAALLLNLASNQAMAAKDPKIIVAKFHADWCGSCKAMEDSLVDLSNKFDGKEVLFVTFDRTNNTTTHHSELLASAMELGEIYDSHAGTGYVLLIDPKNGNVIEKLKGMSTKEMGNSIAAKL
ncbi:MAG: thioredoxin domain-containing protein [Verrucomicrobiota bacterium]